MSKASRAFPLSSPQHYVIRRWTLREASIAGSHKKNTLPKYSNINEPKISNRNNTNKKKTWIWSHQEKTYTFDLQVSATIMMMIRKFFINDDDDDENRR